MPIYRLKTGIVHVKGTKLPAPCGARIQLDGKETVCLAPGEFLCDGPPPPERARDIHGTGTCDRSLCAAHAHQVGPNRHLCPVCFRSDADGRGQRSLFTSLVQP
jgi:hypothetical protein